MTAPRDTLDYLDDIFDAVEKIEVFTRGMSYEEFSGDDMIRGLSTALGGVPVRAHHSSARAERA